jgi:hypothetical protein
MRRGLFEDKFKRETGKRFTGDLQKIKDAVGKENFFVHFTDTPKVGVNPKSQFIPGVYAYPLTRDVYEKFVISVDEYARGQARAGRYVFLLKLKSSARVIEGPELEERIVKNFAHCVAPLLNSELIATTPEHRYMRSEDIVKLIEEHYRDDVLRGLERIRSEVKSIGLRINKKAARLAALRAVIKDIVPNVEEFPAWINEKLWDDSKDSKRNMHRLTLDHIRDDESANGNLAGAIYTYKDHPLLSGIWNSINISNKRAKLQSLVSHSYSGAAMARWEMLRDLFDSPLGTKAGLPIKTKSGEKKEMSQIIDEALKRTLETMKVSKEKLLQVLKQDPIGTNILLGLGDADVIIDRGTAEVKSATAGWGGILGDLETMQAYIRPPIGKAVDIVGMVDRFEGEPDSKVPPGSTPDKDYGKVADDEWRDWAAGRESGARELSPRALALNKKFLGKGFQQAKYDRNDRLVRPGVERPTERWKDAKLEMIIRDCVREMITSED